MSKDYDYSISLVTLHKGNWLHFNLQGQHFAPNYTLNKGGKKYHAYTPELFNVLCYEFEALDRSSKETVMVSNENRTFILNDFCKWYDEGKRVFIENYQPAFIGMINNNAEVLALTLEDYLTNYKSSNFHSEVPMLNEYNVGLDVYVKKKIDLIIMPHNIKSRGFYAGFYTALMEFANRYKILLQTVIERLNDAERTTAPKKPNFKREVLSDAINYQYIEQINSKEITITALVEFYSKLSGYSESTLQSGIFLGIKKEYFNPKLDNPEFQLALGFVLSHPFTNNKEGRKKGRK